MADLLKDATAGSGTFSRNQLFGTNDQAQAAQEAALAQQKRAEELSAIAVYHAKDSQTKMNSLAKGTPQELMAYEQSLTAASDQLARQQKLLASIDPAIMEASKQVLSVLRGESTGIGNAIGTQRNSQRAALVNSLRNQYGPGAESTSIGQRALQQFDAQSAMLQGQAQGSTLAELMGVTNGAPSLNPALQGINQAGANFGNLQNRRIGAEQAGGASVLSAIMGTSQPLVQSAGANQVADLIKTGGQRQFWDNWSNSSMKFGESFAGFGMGKSGGGGGGGGGEQGGGMTSGMQSSDSGGYGSGGGYGYGGYGYNQPTTSSGQASSNPSWNYGGGDRRYGN